MRGRNRFPNLIHLALFAFAFYLYTVPVHASENTVARELGSGQTSFKWVGIIDTGLTAQS